MQAKAHTQNNGKLVDATGLLEILFDKNSRPSLRWLRNQQKVGKIESVKIGRLIFFDPEQVRAKLFPKVGAQ